MARTDFNGRPIYGAELDAARSPIEEQRSPLAPMDPRTGKPKTASEAISTSTKVQTAKAPEAKAAAVYEGLDATQSALNYELTPEQKKPFEAKLDELRGLQQGYWDKYQGDKDRTAWAEAAEKIGLGLVRLGAGIQGLKSGVDLSTGLKFDQTNWDARYQALRDDLKTRLDGVEKETTRVERRSEDAGDKKFRSELEKFQQGESWKRFQEEQKARALDRQAQRELEERKFTESKKTKQQETATEAESKSEEKRLGRLQQKQKQLESRETALAGIATKLTQLDSASGKEKQKIRDEISDLASKSGMEVQPGKKSTWFGLGSEEDWAAAKDGIRAQQQALQQEKAQVESQLYGDTQQAAPTSGEVLVRDPNGNLGKIPANQLDAALAQGYTKAQ
jgi:DNA repair exonuclease SbcCD ATPase subunit